MRPSKTSPSWSGRPHPSSTSPPTEITAAVGTVNGQRAVAVVRAYVNAYFDRYLRHHDSHLLDRPSARYPEVRFDTPAQGSGR